MKREFLQNLKVGDAPLSKEVIDAIMTENGADIEAAKKPYADYDTVKSQLEAARTTIEGLKGQDIETARQSAREWEEKYNTAVSDSAKKLADMEFNHSLEAAINAKKGRDAKAIIAMLDVEALKQSKNQSADITTAIDSLIKDKGYLFESNETPPPYSQGAGTDTGGAAGQFNFGFHGIRAHETGK